MSQRKALSAININDWLIQHRWIWHAGLWLLYALSRLLPYYLTVVYYERRVLYFMLVSEVFFAALVYLTIFGYKQLCYRGYYQVYLGLGLLAWALYVVGLAHAMRYFMGDMQHLKDTSWQSIWIGNSTKYFFAFVFLSMAKYLKDNFIRQYYENQQKQLQLASELANLKAQIGPHFLFNTMNNFYGLAVERSEKLPALMVRLSGLLRYSLYETNSPTVNLCDEIRYLSDYVALEKIRLEDDLDFSFETEIPTDTTVQIAPLLLVVFVENAFKHAKNVPDGRLKIHISARLTSDHTFYFVVSNNCRSVPSDAIGGLGLDNVRKRLQVLYPQERHTLLVQQTNTDFWVQLTIQLSTSQP